MGERHAGATEFKELVSEHRSELHAHCYRMLGSLHDADDALQEALLRAWKALPRFEGRSSLRTWLYRIATNVCLDALGRRPKRVLPVDYGPPSHPSEPGGKPIPQGIWIEPYPDEVFEISDGTVAPEARYERREALELAFVAALQHLPPRQRAALIMRDVLAFSAKETAESLNTTVPSVNGALRRARSAVEDRLPERSQQATLRTLGDRRLREIVERFADSFERGDVDAILAMLADDVTFSMPPHREWCRGREAVAASWLMPGGAPPRLRYVSARANAQPALATYLLDREQDAYLPLALDILGLRGAEIAEVTAFRTPDLFERLGLPSRLPLAPWMISPTLIVRRKRNRRKMMNWTLEVVVVPVSDIDRAKEFYAEKLGFSVDHDTDMGGMGRICQLTPPGSGCSIVIGAKVVPEMTPGSIKGLQLVVPDIRVAREELVKRGVDVSEVQVMGENPQSVGEPLDNVAFVFFSDPDGNGWAVQQISSRG